MAEITSVRATQQGVSVGISVLGREDFLHVHTRRNLDTWLPDEFHISAPNTSGGVEWYRDYAEGIALACEVWDALDYASKLFALTVEGSAADPPVHERADYVVAQYLLWAGVKFGYVRGGDVTDKQRADGFLLDEDGLRATAVGSGARKPPEGRQ